MDYTAKNLQCVNCNKDFVPINEEADNEIRCIDCQTAWRIAGSPGSGKPDNIGWRDWHMFVRPMRRNQN